MNDSDRRSRRQRRDPRSRTVLLSGLIMLGAAMPLQADVDHELESLLIDPVEEHARFESRLKSCDKSEDADEILNCLAGVSVEDPVLAALARVEDSSLPDGTEGDPAAAFAPPGAGPEPGAAGLSPTPPEADPGADPTTGAPQAPDQGGFFSGIVGNLP